MYCKNYILSFIQEGEVHDIIRSSSRGGLANFIPIEGMGHLISEPKFKIPTSPPHPCLLISDKSLRKSTKHSTNLSEKKDKYDKIILKAVFCLLELFVYIQLVTCTRLSCNAQFSQLLVSIIYPFRRRSLKTCCI